MGVTKKKAEIDPMADEYMASLYRAFIIKKADYITVDGWSGGFLRKCAAWAEQQGIIYGEFREGDQYSFYLYRVTEEGKQKLKDFVSV